MSNLYGNILKNGEKSTMYAKQIVYQMNFNFITSDDDEIISKVVIFDTNSCKIYIDNFYIYNVDIVRVYEFVYNNINKLKDISKSIRWASILTVDSLNDIDKILEDDLLSMEEKKFMEEIKKENEPLDLAKIWDYERDSEMYWNQIHSDGYDEGMDDGIEQRNISIINSMINLNYPLEEISKITGKTIDEIKEIGLHNWFLFVISKISNFIYK